MIAETDTAADDGVRRAWLGVGAPIFGLVLVMILLAVSTFAMFARDQDRVFEVNSRRLVASAIDGRTRSLASVTLDYTNWNDAYEAMGQGWDQSWVEDNIYSSVADGMLVFRADGSVRHAWYADGIASRAETITAPAVRAAIATPHLRQLSRARNVSGTVARTFARVGDQLVLVALAPVTPEDDAARLARRSLGDTYLALIDVVSTDELAEMGETLALRDLTFSPVGEGAQPGHIASELETPGGAAVGTLTWPHERPGLAAFQRQVVPVVLALLIIGTFAVLIARILVARQVRTMARAHAALESSRLKSDFLTRVGHELRTPLNAIIGYAEIIQEEHEDESLREDSNRIIVAARHLSHLLNDIFDQSRLDAGRINFKLEVLPVAGLMAELQGLVRPTAKANNVTLDVASSPHAVFTYADHLRLRQCLLNLVGNAIKFAPNGHVSVKSRAAVIGGRAMVVFDITDDGIGIAKAELDNLFRPFSQANAAIGMRFGGTGLGLSISRDLVRVMGGDITVASEAGKGSTFSLSVPAATANALKAA
ncbi:MAG: ATP-binding protein [Hyphomonadaceae bacterium]